MNGPYRRPPPTGDGLRLHLNENTAGCSPKVLEAIARLTPTDFAVYPDYDDVYPPRMQEPRADRRARRYLCQS